MRNLQDAEAIADGNLHRAIAANFVTTPKGRARRLVQHRRQHLQRQEAIARIGPREPRGSEVYPLPVWDWGLAALRDRAYARMRAKKWGGR